MKILKKINKGFILTIIVLVVLAIYLVSVEVRRNESKIKIEETAKEYVQLVNKYAVVPEEMQKLYDTTSEEELEKVNNEFKQKLSEYLNEYEGKLKNKMIDNQTAIKTQKDVMENFLKSTNNNTKSIIVKYDKEIVKIKKYVFDDNQVTVTFDAKTEIERKYLDDGEEKIKKDTSDDKDSSITLQLVDGTWKVVYADIINFENVDDKIYSTTLKLEY